MGDFSATPPIPDEDINESVRQSLIGTAYEASSIERLTGGLVNWGYRANLSKPLPDGTSEVFLKHGETFVAAIPDYKVGLVRCAMEAEALGLLSKSPFTGKTEPHDLYNIIVRTPKLLHFDKQSATQIHELLPNSKTLQAYILDNYSSTTTEEHEPECRLLGEAIGRWLNEFIKFSMSEPGLKQCARNNEEASNIRHHFSYGWLPDRIKEYPGILSEHVPILEQILQMARDELQDESLTLAVHGDLAPANIVITNQPFEKDSETNVFIIDWEVLHMSPRHFDIGQLAMELYILWLRKGITAGLWILQGFLGALDGLNEELAFRVAIHMGSYFVCMSPLKPDWGTPEQIEGFIQIGKNIMVHAWNKDKSWFFDNQLGCLFRSGP